MIRKTVLLLALIIVPLCVLPPQRASAADAEVRYIITNGGADVGGKGEVHYFPQGHHDGPTIDWARSGGSARLPEGAYDVHVTFADGNAKKDVWLDSQSFAGKVEKTVEMGVAITDVRYVITNGGADVGDKGEVHYFPQGHHGGPTIDWARSGGSVRLPEGTYDVHVTFGDRHARKDIWFDNQSFAGKVEKTVEVGVSVAETRYVITNGGVDVGDKGEAHYFPQGHHDGPTIDWARSGGSVRLPEGAYDVHVTFGDGNAHKDIWFDNQSFAGKVEKTVEMGLPVAAVRYVITNGGVDVGAKGQAHYFPQGHHDGPSIDWTKSGNTLRLAAGTYNVQVTFQDGFVRKNVWLDDQSFSGNVEKTVELALRFAEPTVAVTQNGADAGDKAVVAYIDPATHEAIGSVKSSELALLEPGTYDIRASLFSAEGWMRSVALSGKPHLTIEIKPLKTEQLQAKGPPPTACTIEVYGVNFDFDKAVLRPDSDPMLRQVLALFTRTPGFSAEVGGHTDNVGAAEYNLKLSNARAMAVKDWLIAHGVAAARVASHGYGDTRPLVPNTTDENRFKNWRVELRTAACR